MTTPPQQPWAPASPPSITVGGPQGIVIQGDRVQVGGQVVNPGTQGTYAPSSPPAPNVAQLARPAAPQLGQGGSLEMELFRHPRRMPKTLLFGGLFMGLMAVLLATPAMGGFGGLSVMASLLALLSISGAFVLGAKAKRLQASRALPPELELALLELAHAKGGQLRVPETARSLRIPLDEAQEALERLAKRGHAELEVKDAGELVYTIAAGAPVGPALPSSSSNTP